MPEVRGCSKTCLASTGKKETQRVSDCDSFSGGGQMLKSHDMTLQKFEQSPFGNSSKRIAFNFFMLRSWEQNLQNFLDFKRFTHS